MAGQVPGLRGLEYHRGAPGGEDRKKGPVRAVGSGLGVAVNRPKPIAQVETTDELRFPTGMGELDRVLGGEP